jgi:hypothetical protein
MLCNDACAYSVAAVRVVHKILVYVVWLLVLDEP